MRVETGRNRSLHCFDVSQSKGGSMMSEIERLKELIHKAKRIVFLGGAGVSTESGIPDFRSAHGLYGGAQGRSYEEMLSLRFFLNHKDDFWTFYKSTLLYPEAKPNLAHYALARLEKQGKLKAVLTQNIDGLHQAAGSQNVLELHGTVHSNTCMNCGRHYGLHEVLAQSGTPHCLGTAQKPCAGVLRPDIILYGEALNNQVLNDAISAVTQCDLLLVGGTSLMVHPAAGLIGYRQRGVSLVLLNRDETPMDHLAQLIMRENIAQVLDQAIQST